MYPSGSSSSAIKNRSEADRQIAAWLANMLRISETKSKTAASNAAASTEKTVVDHTDNKTAASSSVAGSSLDGQSTGSSSSNLPDDFNTKLGTRGYYMYQTKEEEEYARSMVLLDEHMLELQDTVRSCTERLQFLYVLQWFLTQNSVYVMNTFFHKQGVYSLCQIIKRLRPTDDLAYHLTSCMAPWFTDLMTHPVSKTLVQQCFRHLKHLANYVLHEKLLQSVYDLARTEVGCISVNECMGIINGAEKVALLRQIAIHSVDLSYDFHGNYVVQNALAQGNKDVNESIILMLKGHFVSLSELKEGSHVVEKCLVSCCDFGITAVVEEILSTGEDTPYRIARHTFGNYVFQKALRRTAEAPQHKHLFDRLVKALEPYKKQLVCTAGGRRILNIMREKDGLTKR